jgi:hypothetical protein
MENHILLEYMIPSENGPVIPWQLTDIIGFHLEHAWNHFVVALNWLALWLVLIEAYQWSVNVVSRGRTKHNILGEMHRIEISVKSDPEHGISPTIVCVDTKTRWLLFLDFGSSMYMIWIEVSRHHNFSARCARMNCPEISGNFIIMIFPESQVITPVWS